MAVVPDFLGGGGCFGLGDLGEEGFSRSGWVGG